MNREVTLNDMLNAREMRACRQKELLEKYGGILISFSMNIAGPKKQSPIIRRGFNEGLRRLKAALKAADIKVSGQEEVDTFTGCEALWVVSGLATGESDADLGRKTKKLCARIEDSDALGRLFDMDVLEKGKRWTRKELGLPERKCLICGREGKSCASRRLHPIEELKKATDRILRDYFASKDAWWISSQAARALLYEVCTTPKPGLVDMVNTGSHHDMNVFTFLDSISSLLAYFMKAVSTGQETAMLSPEETFVRLKEAGILAEEEMFKATKGVNTHKGTIFSIGIVCGAIGRLWKPEEPCGEIGKILSECAAIAGPAMDETFSSITRENMKTTGDRLYVEYGLKGVRGEAADGFPSVREVGLPTLKAIMTKNADTKDAGISAETANTSLEEAGRIVLLALMAHTLDTNLIARGGLEGQKWAKERAKALAEATPPPTKEALQDFDREMISKNLSPGGSADLLAITYFLNFLGKR